MRAPGALTPRDASDMIARIAVPETTALTSLSLAWSALVGAVVGSFVNVVVARVPAGESVVHPRSRCARCKVPIRWYDNVPIVSWFVLRGRCRACGERISPRYPAVEALGAAVALAAFARHGLSAAAGAEFAFVSALVALALIDLDTWLLPHALTWPLLAAGILLSIAGFTPAGSIRPAAYGAGVGFAGFAVLSWSGEKLLRKEALGFGDVWLLAAIGAWMGASALLPLVLLASLQGSIVGLVLIALGRAQPGPPIHPSTGPGTTNPDEAVRPSTGSGRTEGSAVDTDWVPPKHAVPFGPFLVLGAVEWLWAGHLLARVVPALGLFR